MPVTVLGAALVLQLDQGELKFDAAGQRAHPIAMLQLDQGELKLGYNVEFTNTGTLQLDQGELKYQNERSLSRYDESFNWTRGN